MNWPPVAVTKPVAAEAGGGRATSAATASASAARAARCRDRDMEPPGGSAAGGVIDGERGGRGVGGAAGGLEAHREGGSGGDGLVPVQVLGGDGLAGLAPGGAPALGEVLVTGEV